MPLLRDAEPAAPASRKPHGLEHEHSGKLPSIEAPGCRPPPHSESGKEKPCPRDPARKPSPRECASLIRRETLMKQRSGNLSAQASSKRLTKALRCKMTRWPRTPCN